MLKRKATERELRRQLAKARKSLHEMAVHRRTVHAYLLHADRQAAIARGALREVVTTSAEDRTNG